MFLFVECTSKNFSGLERRFIFIVTEPKYLISCNNHETNIHFFCQVRNLLRHEVAEDVHDLLVIAHVCYLEALL